MKHFAQTSKRNFGSGVARFALIAALCAVAIPASAAGEWKLDESTSAVTFTADSRLGAVDGVFHKWSMDATVPADLAKGAGKFVVDVASIDTQNRRRDDHLRNPDFFEVEKYPQAVFTIQSVTAEESSVKVLGTMKIKNVERTETLSFRRVESADRLELNGRIIIDRTKYGITYDSIFNPIENEVILRMKLVFKK
ncbi:MAG: YceI family protein [Leptospirales bacterium]|jgi:polyisoprenoid-binding protein YceI